MKWKVVLITWLTVSIALALIGANVSAPFSSESFPFVTQVDKALLDQQQDPTPNPGTSGDDSYSDLPVAHNPGLVLGAVILVLIIIGGVVINSNLFRKK